MGATGEEFASAAIFRVFFDNRIFHVGEPCLACGVGSEHRLRISWIAERTYEIALFEIERRNPAPNGTGLSNTPLFAANQSVSKRAKTRIEAAFRAIISGQAG
jgi:hypothetical protein